MAGKDECKVTVCYDDGTSITRGRTLKDTGYYDIYYHDENGTLQRANYRGFTNAVPVEVANVHQMPKVNITKDIETHLNVLSQLDGPFLLTESPLVKASAIGRITGTHVVDDAIKESNKTIQSNNKLVKNYQKELEEKENELKALPDIQAMSQFTNMYAALVAHIKKLNDDTQEISDRINHLQSLDVSIAQQQKKYSEYCIMKNLLPMVNAAIAKQRIVNGLSMHLSSYQHNNEEIQRQEEVLNNTRVLKLMKPLVDKAYETKQFIDQLESKTATCGRLIAEEFKVRETRNLYQEYKSILNSLIVHCQLLYDYNMRMTPKLLEIDKLELVQDNVVKNLAVLKRTTKRFEENMKNVQQEKNQFILSHGICPCCGQKVEESHISAITTFMEGNNGN
jgi:exonuclease SbcC